MIDGSAKLKLLVISRDALLETPEPSSDKVFRSLARLSRRGLHLLISEPEPDRWVPTRGNVDNALASQKILMKRANDCGGPIEGVYYVPRSLLTQDRNREGALKDILKRFSVKPAEAALLSSSSPFLKAAKRLGIGAYEIAVPGKEGMGILAALNELY